MNPRALLLALTLLCGACSHTGSAPTTATPAAPLRLATYNTSLNSDKDDGLIAALQGDSAQARKIAAVLQQVRPDLVLLNEFDYDDAHRAADLFQQRYLDDAQPLGGAALHYPYCYLAPVNTGVPSGLDLDSNRSVGVVAARAATTPGVTACIRASTACCCCPGTRSTPPRCAASAC